MMYTRRPSRSASRYSVPVLMGRKLSTVDIGAAGRDNAPSRRDKEVLAMGTIPKTLHDHINTAFPAAVCLVATVLPSGFAQVTPRGSTMVFDDDHLALWERGKGSTTTNLVNHSKVTMFFRKPQLREAGVLPKGGIARFYGTAVIHRSGAAYEEVWRRLVQPEKDRDPDKKGFAVLIKVERAEDLDGQPLTLA
jgi:uncharacterized protein